MVVIGAGVIGLEWARSMPASGTEVTVVEYLDAITPGMDAEVAKTFQRILTKNRASSSSWAPPCRGPPRARRAQPSPTSCARTTARHSLEADIVLVATGRKPYTAGLGLEALGVEMGRAAGQDRRHFRTNVPGLYAIGDAIAGPMLAHKAEDEGMAVAEIMAGKHGHVNYGVIPGVIYTTPEVANVGQTEEQLKEEGRAYKVGKFSFMGNGRAKAVFQGDGFVKILADKPPTASWAPYHRAGGGRPDPRDLRGDGIRRLGPGSGPDLPRAPTYSEAVREAALACGDGAIHA
jgi:dihydrolipoamide dehydrogenase